MLIKIAKRLCEEGMNPKEIAEDLKMEEEEVKKYILELKVLGWVKEKIYGSNHFHELTQKGITQIAIEESRCDICEHPKFLSESRKSGTSCVCGKRYYNGMEWKT